MATTVIYLGPLLTLLLLIVIILIAVHFGSSLVSLAINSLIGLAILFLINLLPSIHIDINIWSVLIVAIGGVPGLIIVILLHFAGIAF